MENIHFGCPVCCLTLFDEKQSIYATKCGHVMHKNCLEQRVKVSKHCPDCDKILEPKSWTKLNFITMHEIINNYQTKLQEYQDFRQDLVNYIEEMGQTFELKEEIFAHSKSEILCALGLKSSTFDKFESPELLDRSKDYDTSDFYKEGDHTSLPPGATAKEFKITDEVILEVGRKLKDRGVEKPFPPSCLDFSIPINVSFEYRDKRVFQGQLNNQASRGWGRLRSVDGKSLWEGFFKNGFLNGYGIYIDNDGCYYIGSFLNGKRQGYGIYYDCDGELHEGEKDHAYSDGYNNVYMENKEGDIKLAYKGFMEKGVYQGFGITHDETNGLYEGAWVDGNKQGKGKMQLPSGDVYFGLFEDGKRQGYGEIIQTNGNYFLGFWNDDKMSGYGEWHLLNKDGEGEKVEKAYYEDDVAKYKL